MDGLVAKARLGDEEAFLDLVDRLAPIRKSLIGQFPTLDPDDLDQDLVLVLRDCIRTYDPSLTSFAYYVRTYSRYHCLNKTKEPKVLSLDAKDDDGRSLMDIVMADVDIETDYVRDLRLLKLYESLRDLDKLYRQIIDMYYFYGMGLAEIGHFLGYSTGHISRLKKCAEDMVKKNLQGDDLYDY